MAGYHQTPRHPHRHLPHPRRSFQRVPEEGADAAPHRCDLSCGLWWPVLPNVLKPVTVASITNEKMASATITSTRVKPWPPSSNCSSPATPSTTESRRMLRSLGRPPRTRSPESPEAHRDRGGTPQGRRSATDLPVKPPAVTPESRTPERESGCGLPTGIAVQPHRRSAHRHAHCGWPNHCIGRQSDTENGDGHHSFQQ